MNDELSVDNNEQPATIKVGDTVKLIALPSYIKTADPMPMLRSPDLLNVGDRGIIIDRRPGGYWGVRFDNGAFLLDSQYLELIAWDMFIRSFVAKQLGSPSGLFGRLLMGFLNRGNVDMNDFTMEQLNLQSGERILEIGFGGGYLLDKIIATQTPSFVAGIDPSVNVLQIGNKKFAWQIQQEYVELKQASRESLPYSDRIFDKICTVNTIYFWSDAKSVLDECYRVLKPNGKLVNYYRV